MSMFINLSISLIVISVLFDLIRAETCTKIDSCSCKIESANFVLNLHPLSNPKNPSLQALDTKRRYTYVYNPCDPLPPHAGIKGVSVWQELNSLKYCAGKEDSVTFEGDLQSNTLNLITECMSDTKRTTHINIVCEPERIGSLEYVSDTIDGNYFLQLRTLHACINSSSTSGLSAGSVLLLIFFLLLIVYLTAGILVMKFVKGASGVEMVPNLELWKGLPSLIKDGFVFVSKSCRKDTTYSQI